jgi:hypothetical protein
VGVLTSQPCGPPRPVSGIPSPFNMLLLLESLRIAKDGNASTDRLVDKISFLISLFPHGEDMVVELIKKSVHGKK